MKRLFCCLTIPHARSPSETETELKNKELLSKTLFSSYRTIEGGLEVSHNKNLTGSFRTREGLDYVDLEAGKTCDICTIRPKTHFVVPCGHSACLVCWTNWLFSEDEQLQGMKTMDRLRQSKVKFKKDQVCFVCQKRVRTIKRYSYTLAPRHPYEEDEANTPSGRNREANDNSLRFYEVKLDDCLEEVMKFVLAVKDDLRNDIVGRLETVENHLIELDVNRASNEEKLVVYSVECITVNEVFQKLELLFTNSFWGKLADAMFEFKAALSSFEKIVDSYELNQKSVATETDNESVATSVALGERREAELKSLSGIKDTLELAISGTSVLAQWKRVIKLLNKICGRGRLTKNVLQKFSTVGYEGSINEGFINETLQIVTLGKERMNKDINTLLNTTIPSLLGKVEKAILEINDL